MCKLFTPLMLACVCAPLHPYMFVCVLRKKETVCLSIDIPSYWDFWKEYRLELALHVCLPQTNAFVISYRRGRVNTWRWCGNMFLVSSGSVNGS